MNYNFERLPIAVYADSGQSVSLVSLLQSAYGDNWKTFEHFYVSSGTREDIEKADFSYWDPSKPAVASWTINGTPKPQGYENDKYVALANLGGVNLVAGNSIVDTVRVFALDTSTPDTYAVIQIKVLPTKVAATPSGPPTAHSVVDAAARFDGAFRGVPNLVDCGWITDSVGSGAGAALPVNDQSIDPRQNVEGGYWRIVHRGSDGPRSDWQSMLKPGDIIRMDWADPAQSQHTSMIQVGENEKGQLTVFDNGYFERGSSQSMIGSHLANWATAINPATLTIYRVTTDGLYLLNGTAAAETIAGTVWADDIRAGAGADVILGGSGNDVIRAGTGNDTIAGGTGFDTLTVQGGKASYSWTGSRGALMLSGAEGTDSISDVERIRFDDGQLAFDSDGIAGQTYRLYQAAFSRVPDATGLGHNVRLVDGGMTLAQMANAFINSAEFTQRYGTGLTDAAYINALYQNVLHRDADAGGLSGWQARLADGSWTRTKILVGFSESQENINSTASAVAGGIWLG